MNYFSDIESQITKTTLFSSKDKILLTVSGGMDSMVMLEFFLQSKYQFGIAHVNFHLRKEDSNGDQVFVEETAKKHHIPFFTIDFDTEAYASENGISIEMAARDLRYAWFEEIRSEYNYDYIATAHHADDVAETMQLNLLRATGVRGLIGIRAKYGKIIRPLLYLSKKEIIEIANEKNISFREDYTNADTVILRNRIRHKVIPELSAVNDNYSKQLLKTSSILLQAQNFIDEQITQISSIIKRIHTNYISYDFSGYQNSKNLAFIVYELMQEFGINAQQTESLVAALYHTEFAFFATDSFTLYAGNSKVLVQSIDDNFIEEISIKNIAMLENLFKLSFKEQFTSETIKNIPSDCFVIESGILEFPLLVRNWIAGDSFYPLGMNGKKKVSDFLNDLKLNPVEKQNVRLLINKNQEILWIIGYRADNRFRVQNFEEELIKIEAI